MRHQSHALAILAVAASAVMVLAQSDAPPEHRLVSDGATRTLDTWAEKGMMQSPVSICFDPMGNLYVAETERAGNAVQDTRNIPQLHAVEDDLKFKSVEDRRAQIHRWIADGAFASDYFTKPEDRVRVLSDANGDGKADAARIYCGPFNDELDGIGSGLLWLNSTLYYTCIPDLWALPDADHDLKADSRQSLAHGFGVRWCFFGHDLHGLVPGPDGRIYFSMGDRGYNVTTKEGEAIVGPDRGGVFRCWPDGTGLELFYTGLRNPQELAFSELGDLFTGDNNCDSGDKARIVHIVEGGDSGWRQDVQSLDSRGPWNREFMWFTLAEKTGPQRPAWALPPVEYMCAGPSGLALYPGTGESHAYDGCFFLADFRGGDSSVHAFRCVPDGAFFKVADHVEYFQGRPTITDIAWGYDGRLYMSDWGGGWSPNPNGVILTVTNQTVHNDPTESAAIAQVRDLFKAGFSRRAPNELLTLLAHRDQRVRLAAQYELAGRGLAAGELASIAGDATSAVVTRAHAIWALGQMARKEPGIAPRLLKLLSDPDAEVRTQATRTLGDQRGIVGSEYPQEFRRLLADPSPRVRLAATIALAHNGASESVAPLLDLLTSNNNADLTLRHGAAFALSKVADPDDLATYAAGHELPAAARLGVVLALRRNSSEAVSDYLTDPDPGVAIEAARAVYDLRLAAGLPSLAALLDSEIGADRAIEPFMRRVIEANVLLGAPENATRLASFAARDGIEPKWRKLALERLLNWDLPLPREGVWGNWVGLPGRPRADVAAAVEPRMEDIFKTSAADDELTSLAYRVQARHALHLSAEDLAARAGDASLPTAERLADLDQLAATSTDSPLLARTATGLFADPSAEGALRRRAMDLLAEFSPRDAVELLRGAASSGPADDRQHAVRALASIKSPEAAAAMAEFVANLAKPFVDREIALDVYEAAMSLPEEDPSHRAAEPIGLQGSRPPGFATRLLSVGGDPGRGREVFLHHRSAECIRCHTTEGPATATAPSLRGVGDRKTPEKIVESIVEPGAEIAPGFGTISAMPVMTQFLNPGEVRDIVAYLETLGTASRGAAHAPPTPHAPLAKGPASGLGTPVARVLVFVLAVLLASVVWRSVTRRA